MFESEVNPFGVRKADVIVAIPSYKEAESIGYPTRQAAEGLVKYFPDRSSVIINCDNGSPDHTREVFLGTPVGVPKIYISTPAGMVGKGNNLKNLFRKAIDLQAKAVLVVDADLKTIRPEWIRNLAEPLFSGYSFVAPLYVRHKYDDPFTSEIAYPLIRALYGRRVRQPLSGEFGFSGQLAQVFLSSPLWNDQIARFGIDVWMTTLALGQKTQFCQSFMGGPKVHRPKDPADSLGPLFKEAIGTIFSLMPYFEKSWMAVKYSKPTAIYGFGPGEVEIPPKVDVEGERLLQSFHEGFGLYGAAWERFLSRDLYAKLLEMEGMKKGLFTFPADLWARLLYDLAISHQEAPDQRDLLLESLIPLYHGRIFSFVRKTRRMSIRQAEETIEEDCMTFELTKPYLVGRWAERVRPKGTG
jgi:glucosylglycerate synthase